MPNQQSLFVADTAFIEPHTIDKYNLLSVFPRKKGDGAYRGSLDNLLQRSKLQSAYFDTLLPELVPIFENYIPSAESEVKHFIRPVLVKLTSLFVDRAIRVLHRIKQCEDNSFSVVSVAPIECFQKLTEIDQSWHLNQDLIQRIMLALGLEKVRVFDKENYPEYPNEYIQPNLIFVPQQPGLAGVITKLLSQYYKVLHYLPSRKARLLSHGFGTDSYYLVKRGFFGLSGDFQKFVRLKLTPSEINTELRESLSKELEGVVTPHFKLLLSKIDPPMGESEQVFLSKAYMKIFVDWFPVGFLEGLASNLEQARKSLNMGSFEGLIGHDMVSDSGYFSGAATRLAGKTVIGVQHGSHYGYLEDNFQIGQFEYYFYDKLITWGWTNIDDHFPQCKTIPLPNPKLSEQPFKANYLRTVTSPKANKRDVLFLSDIFHRFPGISTCGQVRVDFIDDITNSQESLTRAISNAGLTLDHKPYNMRFVELYSEHFRRLETAGGSGYRLLESRHKGLTVNMLKTCRIVLFDQIGCGALECFTSEVPTMVYWQRINARESLWAKELIAELESCGVVHQNPNELAQEIKVYLADPEAWMNNKNRKQAIQEFCKVFAWADKKWPSLWRKCLEGFY